MKSIILTILLCLVCQVTWACGFGSPIAGGMCRGYLTSGTTWTVPSDWNNSSNTIECIGGGAAGDKGNDTPGIGAGGGGGAYSRSVNVVLSGTINYVVGAGGTTDAARATALLPTERRSAARPAWPRMARQSALARSNSVAAAPSATPQAIGLTPMDR